MPKVLTQAQIETFERDGCLSPVRAMSAERARYYRERFEALEARVPDIKKMKTKSHLLAPWVLEIAEDPHVLDIFEDLVGPNLRCWSMAWRVKKADRETFAGWHQASAYGAARQGILGGPAPVACAGARAWRAGRRRRSPGAAWPCPRAGWRRAACAACPARTSGASSSTPRRTTPRAASPRASSSPPRSTSPRRGISRPS